MSLEVEEPETERRYSESLIGAETAMLTDDEV